MDTKFEIQWVSDAITGDQNAISSLYEKTYNNVYLTIKSMVCTDEETVLDLLQDTYIKAFQNLSKLDDPERFTAWVKSIARNLTLDYLKKKKLVLFTDLADEKSGFVEVEDKDTYHLPEAAIDQKETIRLVREILDSLPDGQRVAVSMYYYQDMSIKEIAVALGRSEGTIKAQLSNGRKAIEKKVCELEKKDGIKLYSLAPLPFFLLLLQNLSSTTAEADAAVLGYVLQAANVASGAAVAAETTAAVSTGAAAAAASSGATAATASASAAVAGGLAAKIAAIPLVVKGIAAITAVSVGIGCIAAAVPGNDPTPTEPVLNQTAATETFYETAGTTEPSFLFTEPSETVWQTDPTQLTTAPTEVTQPTELVTEPPEEEVTEPSVEQTEAEVTEPSTEPSAEQTEVEVTEPSAEPSSGSDEEDSGGEGEIADTIAPTEAGATDANEVTWSLSDDGILTISGNGAMEDYSYNFTAPWYDTRSSITTVIIEDGVTTIGDYAFSFCTNLTNITIPSTVTSIGCDAFYHCSSLIDINVPYGVTTIGSCAFVSCSSLMEFAIPDSVTTIAFGAFQACSSLSEITIPSSVVNIDYYAFNSCDSMTGIWVDKDNAYYVSDEYGVLFNKDKTELLQAPGAISGDYVIPDGVTTIGPNAFAGCDALTGIAIPSGVVSIGSDAFVNCYRLTSVTIPEGVTAIYGGAFNYCTRLSSVTIPSSVTEIGAHAFNSTPYLESITDESGFAIINGILIDYSGTADNVIIPSGVTRIGSDPFFNRASLLSVTIPEGVTSIDTSAFSYCTGLTEMIIPASVTSIGNNTFSRCTGLTAVRFLGDAPSFGYYSPFYEVTATVYYPAGNDTWTSSVMKNYGGNLTWVAYDEE